MTEIVSTAAAAVVALGILVLAFVTFARQRSSRTPLLAQRVLVQLVDGSAVAGVLTRHVGEYLVIENGRLHENGTEVGIDGAAWLPVARVNWIQTEGGSS